MNFYEWFFLEKDRPAAGLFSWSHLLSVTITLVGLTILGYFLGKKYKDNPKAQRNVLIITSILLVSLHLMRVIFLLVINEDKWNIILENLPLFFCNMIIVVVPLAALTKGRVQDISLDFIAICGFIMGTLGNYLAGNIYDSHPAFCYLSLISNLGHSLSMFIAMFVFKAKMNKMEKRNIPFVIGLLIIYMSIALTVDYLTGKNFMFFLGGDGTAFQILLDGVQGNLIVYQILLYILHSAYIVVFYLIYYPVKKAIDNKKKRADS